MGNVIGRSNGVRQAKVTLELLALAYVIRRWSITSPNSIVGSLNQKLTGYRPWQVRGIAWTGCALQSWVLSGLPLLLLRCHFPIPWSLLLAFPLHPTAS